MVSHSPCTISWCSLEADVCGVSSHHTGTHVCVTARHIHPLLQQVQQCSCGFTQSRSVCTPSPSPLPPRTRSCVWMHKHTHAPPPHTHNHTPMDHTPPFSSIWACPQTSGAALLFLQQAHPNLTLADTSRMQLFVRAHRGTVALECSLQQDNVWALKERLAACNPQLGPAESMVGAFCTDSLAVMRPGCPEPIAILHTRFSLTLQNPSSADLSVVRACPRGWPAAARLRSAARQHAAPLLTASGRGWRWGFHGS